MDGEVAAGGEDPQQDGVDGGLGDDAVAGRQVQAELEHGHGRQAQRAVRVVQGHRDAVKVAQVDEVS